LVRSQICVDPATGGMAVDAVNHGAIEIANCVASGFTIVSGVINLPAMLLVLLLTGLLILGIRESARFNNIIVFIKVAIVLMVIGFGIKYVDTANWHPFIPDNTGTFGSFGLSGVVRGAGVIFFAYI